MGAQLSTMRQSVRVQRYHGMSSRGQYVRKRSERCFERHDAALLYERSEHHHIGNTRITQAFGNIVGPDLDPVDIDPSRPNRDQ